VGRFVNTETPSVNNSANNEDSLRRLLDACAEASVPGWDGYEGQPVSKPTAAQAVAFMDMLPSALPGPDVMPNSDGEIAFEWALGPRRLLTVSINGSGRLSYAALFGAARMYGTEQMLDEVPEAIVLAFQRLYGQR
jgi:hypothetical protein